MPSLTGLPPKDTYTFLLQINGGLTNSLKIIEDGNGNDLPIAVSTTDFTFNGQTVATVNSLASYQPLDGDLTSLSALTGTNTIYYRSGTNTWTPVTIGSNLTFSGGILSASTGASVGGSDGQIQYNNSGSLGGLAFTAVSTSGTLLRLTAQASNDIPLAIRRHSSQSVYMLPMQTSDGTTVGGFNNNGALQFVNGNASFDENTTTDGFYLGYASGSPRFMIRSGGTSWQIDNNGGAFRWFTPGVVRMSLSTSFGLSVADNVSFGGGPADARGTIRDASAGKVMLDLVNDVTSPTAPVLRGRMSSSTTRRETFDLFQNWVDSTDATRRAQVTYRVYDTSARTVSRDYSDGSRGYRAHTLHTTAPADSDLQNSELVFYQDGSGTIFVKYKNSSGTVYNQSISTAGVIP